jgi:hypothetical protein
MFAILLVTFVFMFALLMFNIIDLQRDQMIRNKLYLFLSIFIFNSICQMIMLLYHRKIVNIGIILKKSLQLGLLTVVGYTIFNDIEVSAYDIDMSVIDKIKLSIIIILFIAFGDVFDWLTTVKNGNINDCMNLLYNKT